MSLLRRLNRPEYLFRPRSVVKRLRQGGRHSWDSNSTIRVSLPWSQQITVFGDEIGHTIIASGIFDLCVTETIFRLLDGGDRAVDVGANVGYLTNLMAQRVGPSGTVTAFEPHPTVFLVLERNVRRWDRDRGIAGVDARRIALSSARGTGRLRSHGPEESQLGLSYLAAARDVDDASGFTVELAKLDDLFRDDEVQLIKIDVEGHEHSVLRGGESMLGGGRVRDIVFEEHAIYPAPSMTFLEQHGMTLFTLRQSVLGLDVHPVEEGPAPPVWPGPNYLATLDPERALTRLSPRGWQCLGGVAGLGRAVPRPRLT